MLERLYSLFTLTLILCACGSDTPDIQVVCQRDNIGNYIIKWETYPQLQGVLKLYVSDIPGSFNKSAPAVYTDISRGITTYVTNDNVTRKYFLLSFNDKYFAESGSRSVSMDSVQNLREMGGYKTMTGKTVKWGKIYRSGELSAMGDIDSLRFNKLGVKSVIDFSAPDSIDVSSGRLGNASVIGIPVSNGNVGLIFDKIRDGRLRKGDGTIFMQDMYIRFADTYKNQFAEAFRILLDEASYPVLFSCELGKDPSGFFAALLLLALDVPEATVRQDYMLSNDYLDLKRFGTFVREMDPEAQETITLLLTVNETYLDAVLMKIRKEYGSYQKYLSKELNLTDKDREKLKEILLY